MQKTRRSLGLLLVSTLLVSTLLAATLLTAAASAAPPNAGVAGYEQLNQPIGALWTWDFPGGSRGKKPCLVFRGSQDDPAVVGASVPLFSDGFQSGDTRAWSSTVL